MEGGNSSGNAALSIFMDRTNLSSLSKCIMKFELENLLIYCKLEYLVSILKKSYHLKKKCGWHVMNTP